MEHRPAHVEQSVLSDRVIGLDDKQRFVLVDANTPTPAGHVRLQIGQTFPLMGAWWRVQSIGARTMTLEIQGPTGKHKANKRKRGKR